jgi:hypothetical protein
MTPRKQGLVRCCAPTLEGGRCTRLVQPGSSCGFHRPVPVKPPPPAERPRPQVCGCRRPIVWQDELGPRCVRCGKWIELPAEEQLQLDVDQPVAAAVMTRSLR